MQRLRLAIPVLMLAVGLAALAWSVAYRWRPQFTFPWPTSGLSQTHDRGFAYVIGGRLFIVRQRAQLSPTAGSPEPILLDRAEDATQGAAGNAFIADMTASGVTTVRTIDGSVQGGIMTGSVEQSLEQRQWSWSGFDSWQVSAGRVILNGVVVTGSIGATSIPLWPFVLVGVVGGLLLYRNWRRRWATLQGLCPECGYDLRESPDRCPECGRPRDGVAGA